MIFYRFYSNKKPEAKPRAFWAIKSTLKSIFYHFPLIHLSDPTAAISRFFVVGKDERGRKKVMSRRLKKQIVG